MMPNRPGLALSVVTVLLVGLFAGTCAAGLAAPVSGAHDGCITLKSEQLGSPKMALAEPCGRATGRRSDLHHRWRQRHADLLGALMRIRHAAGAFL